PSEWRELSQGFVIPETFRPSTPTAQPGMPSQVLPADQFTVYVTGNDGHFSENYEQFDTTYPHIFGVGRAETPAEIDYDDLRQQLQLATNQNRTAIFDIEHLPISVVDDGAEAVDRSMAVYQAVIDFARAEFPEMKIGFYGTFPNREYWTPIYYRRALQAAANGEGGYWESNVQRFTDQYNAWQTSNEYLRPWAEQVDVIYPSLYTFGQNQEEWQWYAEENIKQASTFGKPVVPFIWNRYHQGFVQRKWELLESDYWRMQLDLVREQSAGVVIWDFNGTRTNLPFNVVDDYNGDEAWYLETVDFLEDLFANDDPTAS
ncbi:MAG: hypothetical protein AAF743_13785, partial [Planctomycetota bacterium]